jgi:hypothetical protein
VSTGCFKSPSDCKDNDCKFIFKWSNTSDSVNFVLAGKINSFTNKYLAIGFSNDDKMVCILQQSLEDLKC